MPVWKQQKNIGKRRRGVLMTKAGSIQTPFFMPDATRASVRGVSGNDLVKVGVDAMVINTYHLMLQPGVEFIKKTGGSVSQPETLRTSMRAGDAQLVRRATLVRNVVSPAGWAHWFMHWNKLLLSDSGGYQVFSLIHKNATLGRITEKGAEFRSVLDGSKQMLTPERSIEIQFDLGVDMMVVLDEPRPNSATEQQVTDAVERTLRWARRSKVEYEKQIESRGLNEKNRPLIFGVVQGGMFRELRKRCALGLIEIGFDGYGFGGRHIDVEGNFLEDIVSYTASLIPEESVRFALGIGNPMDIVRCHSFGWDIFDCVIPTREGRHGRLFIWLHDALSLDGSFYQTINIQNEQFQEDFSSVDPTCDCELCVKHTRAYLRHLFKVGDPLSGQLASLHNLRFYMKLMEKLREE